MTSEQAFVIGYDISNPRRLLRVHHEMCKHASPLEYSIFLLVGSDAAKDRCLQEIDALIEPQDDDVRCHALPGRSFQGRIGRANLPAEILWTSLPAAIACRRAQGANESDVLIPPSGYLQVNLQE